MAGERLDILMLKMVQEQSRRGCNLGRERGGGTGRRRRRRGRGRGRKLTRNNVRREK